jgi:hypothetical protein
LGSDARSCDDGVGDEAEQQPGEITDRIGRYREAGITTLLAKLDGDYAGQLATLQQLLGIVSATR